MLDVRHRGPGESITEEDIKEALAKVEQKVLRGGGEPVLLLTEAQAELASELEEAASHEGRP